MKAPDYASSFEKHRSQTTEATLALLDSILHYVPSYPAARIIDIGCGTGRHALLLASASEAQIVATDVSRAMLEQGHSKDRDGQVYWTLSDACRMPFAADRFDAALLFLVLHLVKDPEKALHEAFDSCGQGGIVWHYLTLTRS